MPRKPGVTKSVEVIANPLAWHELENAKLTAESVRLKLENLLRFLTGPGRKDTSITAFVDAYERVSENEALTPVGVAPATDQIINRLIIPLRHAKASFMLGNFSKEESHSANDAFVCYRYSTIQSDTIMLRSWIPRPPSRQERTQAPWFLILDQSRPEARRSDHGDDRG